MSGINARQYSAIYSAISELGMMGRVMESMANLTKCNHRDYHTEIDRAKRIMEISKRAEDALHELELSDPFEVV